MYRPQYVNEEQPGEQDFVYSFAGFNVPSFAGNLGAGLAAANIPLVLDPDAPFTLRGVKVFNTPLGLSVRFRDPFGNYLSDDMNPTLEDLTYTPSAVAFLASLTVPVETEIDCPRGAVLWVDLINTLAAPASLASLEIVLMGVKRYD